MGSGIRLLGFRLILLLTVGYHVSYVNSLYSFFYLCNGNNSSWGCEDSWCCKDQVSRALNSYSRKRYQMYANAIIVGTENLKLYRLSEDFMCIPRRNPWSFIYGLFTFTFRELNPGHGFTSYMSQLSKEHSLTIILLIWAYP